MRLAPATDADFRWLLGEGKPPRAHRVAPDLASREVLEIIRSLPANWLMVADGEIVGIISLKAAFGDQAEIGYGVACSRCGQGFASAAVAALMPILARSGIRVVVAETAVDNPASQRVLQDNGFVDVGERNDEEDGLLMVWRADLTAAGKNAQG
jgi:RimJ/RimL family protein N-acetyltransferase